VIAQSFQEACQRYSTREAVVDGARRISYRELGILVDDFCTQLGDEWQIRSGNVVALHLHNSLEYICAFFALMHLGATALLVSSRWKSSELKETIQVLPFQAVITTDKLLSEWQEISSQHRLLKILAEALISSSGLSTERTTTRVYSSGKGEEEALIFCTSGTTGRPKFVVRSGKSLLINAGNVAKALNFAPGCRILSVIPFFHANGFSNCLFMPLLHGGTLCLMPQFDPGEMSALIAREKIQMVMGSPFIYGRLDNANPENWKSVDTTISSGALLPSETRNDFRRRLGLEIRELYGSSETGTIAIQPAGDNQKDGSVGTPIPGIDVEIWDSENRPLAAGSLGEVAVRSAAAMSGYWEQGGLSRSAFVRGFFRMGDLGCIDYSGQLIIKGRIKKIINTGGVKVDPEEIARVIRQLPGVEDCRVEGIAHPVQTEIIAATILTKPETRLTRKDIVKHCRRFLAEYKIPRQILFTTSRRNDILGKNSFA